MTWIGPDPDLRRGAKSFARGPNPELRRGPGAGGGEGPGAGATGAGTSLARGANPALRKGPSGCARGSAYARRMAEDSAAHPVAVAGS